VVKSLIKLANHLDSSGLYNQADCIDKIILKISLGSWAWTYEASTPEDKEKIKNAFSLLKKNNDLVLGHGTQYLESAENILKNGFNLNRSLNTTFLKLDNYDQLAEWPYGEGSSYICFIKIPIEIHRLSVKKNKELGGYFMEHLLTEAKRWEPISWKKEAMEPIDDGILSKPGSKGKGGTIPNYFIHSYWDAEKRNLVKNEEFDQEKINNHFSEEIKEMAKSNYEIEQKKKEEDESAANFFQNINIPKYTEEDSDSLPHDDGWDF